MDIAAQRSPFVDNVRGWAVINMVVFHAIWFAAFTELLPKSIRFERWYDIWGECILAVFLFCMGWGFSLANANGIQIQKFLRQWLKVAAAAVAITAASYWFAPSYFIWFGVLHSMLASLPLALLLRAAPFAAIAVGLVLMTPYVTTLNQYVFPPLSSSFDHVGLAPWFGMIAFGLAAGNCSLHTWRPIGMHTAIAWCGRHSLLIYLLHPLVLLVTVKGMNAVLEH